MKETLLAALPAAIPTITVLIALLDNQVAINRLASDIVDLRKQVHDDTSGLRKQLHEDIVMLVGRDIDKSERLARLEERRKLSLQPVFTSTRAFERLTA